MACGVMGFLAFHYVRALAPVKPAAGAAAVITGKLGGSETSLTTYTILSNLAAAVVIPLVFPLVEKHVDASFASQCVAILRRVFPLLIFPFLLAWGCGSFFRGRMRGWWRIAGIWRFICGVSG